MTFRPVFIVALAALALATPPRALAQGPAGSDTLSRRAVAESLKVLNQLGKYVKDHPKDAAAHYHRGMVAFALAERTWSKDTIPGLNYREMRLIAFDALMAALELDSKNIQYQRSVAAYHAADHSILGRFSGRPLTCDANLDHYAADTNAVSRAETMFLAGWVCWVDFDGYQDRGLSSSEDSPPPQMNGGNASLEPPKDAAPTSVCGGSFKGVPAAMKAAFVDNIDCLHMPVAVVMQRAIEGVTNTLRVMPFDVAGETDFLRAKTLFNAAYTLTPKNDNAYRALAMLYAAHDEWPELQRLGRDRTQLVPSDPWGWMTVALATYRIKPGKESGAMIDDAFARLDQKERAQLDRLERVLRPTDTTKFHMLDAAGRTATANTSWMLADPLWSAPQAPPRTEFLARIIYSELRWSVPAQHAHGADTDRGEIYIRYGPPAKVVGETVPEHHTMYTFWIYNSNLIFAFDKFLHTGTARLDLQDYALNEKAREWQPARWDNIASTRIDSMPTQAVRFRAGADSVELFLATRAPVDTMRALGVANAQPSAHMWLVPFGPAGAFVDSVRLGAGGYLQWIRRVTPGPYYYRIEATAPGLEIAGRTTAQITIGPDSASGFRLIGFGLSDVLVATRATSRVPLHRWSDLDVVPVLGDIPKGSEIALVWENYELGHQGNNARYDVAITIDRELSKSGQIGARIANMLGVGVSTSKDKVAMKFERNPAYAPVITDNVSLALRDTPPGSYRLTVQVTDRVSGRMSSRTVRIVIHE